MKRPNTGAIAACLVAICVGVVSAQRGAAPRSGGPAAKPASATGPILVVETVKGVIEIQTYPADAPKTVEHIVALANRRFYNGLRVHRVSPGFVVQFGDPQTRDMTKRDRWGSGGSGDYIGVSEAKRPHRVGSVAAAHAGDPRYADSQMYISFAAQPKLDKNFTVFGQVISGMDVARKLAVNDIIRRVTVK